MDVLAPVAAGKPSMLKILSIIGMAISAVLLVIFGLDLSMGFPFDGRSGMMDIGFIVCSGILGYLSWNTFREQV